MKNLDWQIVCDSIERAATNRYEENSIAKRFFTPWQVLQCYFVAGIMEIDNDQLRTEMLWVYEGAIEHIKRKGEYEEISDIMKEGRAFLNTMQRSAAV